MNRAIGGDPAPVLLTCRSFVDGVEVTGGRQARPRSMVFLGFANADKGKDLKGEQSRSNQLCIYHWKFWGPLGLDF